MRHRNASGMGRMALALACAAAIGGCGMPGPLAREGSVTVTKVDRVIWNAEPEPALYRITFDAQRMLQIRRESQTMRAPVTPDPYAAEGWLLEREAEHELRSRRLCDGNVRLAGVLDEGDGKSGASGIFKCAPSLF